MVDDKVLKYLLINTLQTDSFQNFKTIWSSIIGVTPESFKTQLTEKLTENLEVFKNGIGVSALTVFDMEKNGFIYVDEDIERVTGIPKPLYFEKGASYILSRAILPHVPLLISSTLKQRNFFKNKSKEFYDNFIVNREFAYKSKREPVNWVLHQVVKHLFNASGKLFGVVVLQTQLKNSNYIGKFRFNIYDKKKNVIVYPKLGIKHSHIHDLTDRERQVINLLLQNKTNKAIAEELHISYHTVRTHRKSAMKKLNCHSIYELAREYSVLLNGD